LIAYALQDEGGYAGINIIISLALFVLTGMSDILTIYILFTEPVHLQILFK